MVSRVQPFLKEICPVGQMDKHCNVSHSALPIKGGGMAGSEGVIQAAGI